MSVPWGWQWRLIDDYKGFGDLNWQESNETNVVKGKKTINLSIKGQNALLLEGVNMVEQWGDLRLVVQLGWLMSLAIEKSLVLFFLVCWRTEDFPETDDRVGQKRTLRLCKQGLERLACKERILSFLHFLNFLNIYLFNFCLFRAAAPAAYGSSRL